METENKIAVNLRAMRERAGLSPEKLGAAIGKDRATIYNWESGRTSPPAAMLPIIADALGCTIADLVEV